MERGYLLHPDTSRETIVLRSDLLHGLQDTLGGHVEVVRPRFLPRPFVLICDEDFLAKRLPYNTLASLMYGTPFHGHPICGDVVIMKVGFTDEGEDVIGLTEHEVVYLESLLQFMAA